MTQEELISLRGREAYQSIHQLWLDNPATKTQINQLRKKVDESLLRAKALSNDLSQDAEIARLVRRIAILEEAINILLTP